MDITTTIQSLLTCNGSAGCAMAQCTEDTKRAIALAPKGVKALLLLNGLVGLADLIERRDDVSDELRTVLRTNHRIVEARALLEGIEP